MLKFICKWVIWRSFSVCPVHFPNCNTSSVMMNQQSLANIGYEKENVLKCSTNFIIIWGLQDISSYDGCLWGQVKWRGHLLMVKTDRKFQTTSPKMVAVTYKRWLVAKRGSSYRWNIITFLQCFLWKKYNGNNSSPIWRIQKRYFCDLHGGLTVNKPSFKFTSWWQITFMLSKKQGMSQHKDTHILNSQSTTTWLYNYPKFLIVQRLNKETFFL